MAARERTYAQARADISALESVHIRAGDGGRSQRKPSTNDFSNAKEGAPRRAFPFMPKHERKRKNVSAPLNQFRTLRNRVFHNESICWNLCRVEEIHREMVTMMGWINKDVPGWLEQTDRFHDVCRQIREAISLYSRRINAGSISPSLIKRKGICSTTASMSFLSLSSWRLSICCLVGCEGMKGKRSFRRWTQSLLFCG